MLAINSAVTESSTLQAWTLDVGTTPVRLSAARTAFKFGVRITAGPEAIVYIGLDNNPSIPLATHLAQDGFPLSAFDQPLELPIGDLFDVWAVASGPSGKLHLVGS